MKPHDSLVRLKEFQVTEKRRQLQQLQMMIAEFDRMVKELEHQISLEVEPGSQLKGSEAELHSAFSNLVFNAVKYTPAQGSIQIRWWSDGQGAHLAVTDNGIGIEARHLPRLSERFYRVDSSRASSTGGTGLGLAIVKHVLMRHNGHLQVQSRPGLGSTFTCHFKPATLGNVAL